MKQSIGTYHVCDIHHDIIEIYQLPQCLSFFYHPADSPNHFPRPSPICANVNKQRAKLPQIDIPAINKTLASARVAHNSCQRLIHFVGNRSGHFAHQSHAAEVGEFSAMSLRIQLCQLPLTDVDARTNVTEKRAIGSEARRSSVQKPAIFPVT